ncbi:MAG TPA: hypothetical protein VNM48_14405 [Chloroflexota bacterium]|nr:hypothetical protein [Chloroflexota bacterium]
MAQRKAIPSLHNSARSKKVLRSYTDAMLKGHTEVLALIDARLPTLADRPNLEAHSTTTRDRVVHHLKQAKALKKKFMGLVKAVNGCVRSSLFLRPLVKAGLGRKPPRGKT